MQIEEFRRYGHVLIDWLADFHANAKTLPVEAQSKPGDVESLSTPAEAGGLSVNPSQEFNFVTNVHHGRNFGLALPTLMQSQSG